MMEGAKSLGSPMGKGHGAKPVASPVFQSHGDKYLGT